MNDKQKKSQMNLLPVIVLIVLIVGAGYFLLQGDIKFPKFGDNTPEIRRLNGFPTVIYTDKVLDKQRAVIKNEQELTQFLNDVDPSGISQVREKINFGKEMLIAASTATLDKTGTDFKIKKIYQDKGNKTLLVTLRQSDSGDTCEVEQNKNIAVDIVAVNKIDWEVSFETVKELKECKSVSQESTDTANVKQKD